jgi:hypothetical protein
MNKTSRTFKNCKYEKNTKVDNQEVKNEKNFVFDEKSCPVTATMQVWRIKAKCKGNYSINAYPTVERIRIRWDY